MNNNSSQQVKTKMKKSNNLRPSPELVIRTIGIPFCRMAVFCHFPGYWDGRENSRGHHILIINIGSEMTFHFQVDTADT
jgi:hypothetical protein